MKKSAKSPYQIKDGKVYYTPSTKKSLKAVKADAASFESLKFGYARDNSHVFRDGKRLRGADPISFEPIAQGFALDKKFVYVANSRTELDIGQDNSRSQILSHPEYEDLRILILGHNAYCLWDDRFFWVAENIEPDSFEILHHSYCRDANSIRIYGKIVASNSGQKVSTRDYLLIVDHDVFVGFTCIPGAADSIVRVGTCLIDDKNVYSLTGDILAEVKDPEVENVSEKLAKDSFLTIARNVFGLYDRNYFRQGPPEGGGRELNDNILPPAEVNFTGPGTSITVNGRTFTGRISAFQLFLSRAWSWCRGYTIEGEPTIVFSNYHGSNERSFDNFVEEVFQNHYDDFATLIIWFERNNEKEEAEFLLDLVVRYLHDDIAEFYSGIPVKVLSRLKTPTEWYEKEYKLKSTYLANAKLTVEVQSSEKDPVSRADMAWRLCQMVLGTTKLHAFQKAVFRPLMKLIPEEKNDTVKQWLLLALELGCALRHYHVEIYDEDSHDAYADVKELATFLISQGVNTPINHARLWEWAHLTQDTGQIEACEQALDDVIKLDCLALAAAGMFHSSPYPDFLFFLSLLSLRVAIHSTGETATKILANALKYVEVARRKYNSRSSGTSLADYQELLFAVAEKHGLSLPFEDRRIKDSCSGYANKMTTLAEASYVLTGFEKIDSGKYDQSSPLRYLDWPVDEEGPALEVGLGDFIGLSYFLDGQPWNRQVDVCITVHHPPLKSSGQTKTEYPIAPSYLGMKNSFFWKFETEDELIEGNWRIEVSLPKDKTTNRKLKLKPLSVEFEIKLKAAVAD